MSVWSQKTGVTEFAEPTEGQDCDTLGQNVGLLGGSTRVPSRSSTVVSGHTWVAHKNIRVVRKCAVCSPAMLGCYTGRVHLGYMQPIEMALPGTLQDHSGTVLRWYTIRKDVTQVFGGGFKRHRDMAPVYKQLY